MNGQAGCYRVFLVKAGLILAGGLVIMLVFTVAIVLARQGPRWVPAPPSR